MPAHEHGRGVSRSVPSAPPSCYSTYRGTAGSIVHGRSPAAAQHRRPDSEPPVPGRNYEFGPPVRTAGAVHCTSHQSAAPSSTACSGRLPGSARTAGCQSGHPCDHHHRGPPHQTPYPGRTRRAPPPQALLQLRRQIYQGP
jgi:hypothetical protein